MNRNNLQQIFQHYIDKFEFINDAENEEYFKWQACHEFPLLMGKALAASDEDFAEALKEVKKCTGNIIDSYTQPLAGLVECAKQQPAEVRELLANLFADDGGDLEVQEEKIAGFFKRSGEILDECGYSGSFLYRQNSHSVSALLFLNDPDHHYMYKATQSRRFADCVECYDDWGTGDNIKLAPYYRICDELVEAIKSTPELLRTNEGLFDGRLKLKGGELHPDAEKHILAFNIIYCCSVYNLFDEISYTQRNAKEKELYLAEKAKAEKLKQDFEKAKADMDRLEAALQYFTGIISVGDEIEHPKYGRGKVESINEKTVEAVFPEKKVKLGLAAGIAGGFVRMDKPGFVEKVAEYIDVLKKQGEIPAKLDFAVRALELYEEYLE